MGILNRTPDSFYERHFSIDDALERAEQIAAEGGEVVDVGGVKAGAGPPVSVAEEIDRVCPVVNAVSSRFDVAVSVDTYRSPVAAAALDAGASLINDISGLSDPETLPTVSAAGASIVITHMQGEPRVPHLEPRYRNLVSEVVGFLADRAALADAGGVDAEHVVVDPGLDLGKTYAQSLVLVRELSQLMVIGSVVLLSASHKGFLGSVAPLKVDERHEATMACVAYGFAHGARLFRAHSVAETVRVCRTMEGILTADASDPWVSRYDPDAG